MTTTQRATPKLRLTIEVDGINVDDINDLVEMMRRDFGYGEEFTALDILTESMEDQAVIVIAAHEGDTGTKFMYPYHARIVAAEIVAPDGETL